MSVKVRPHYGLYISCLVRRSLHNSSICYRHPRTKADAMSDEDPPIQKHELSEAQTVQELGEHRITVSKAQNVAEVLAKLGPLLNGQGDPPKQRWYLCLDGKGIRRSFYFKGFKKTWVGGECDQFSRLMCSEADMSQRASCRPSQRNANRKIIIQNGGMYVWSLTRLSRKYRWYLIKLRQAYNHTFIQWTTHRPEGLSIKDVEMASWCDEQAKLHEERFDVEPAPFKVFDFV